MATSVIAAAAARAEREMIAHFRDARATTPERATTLPSASGVGRRRLRQLLDAQVIREGEGGWWLDEAIYESYRADRRAAVVGILVAVVAILIAVLLAKRAA